MRTETKEKTGLGNYFIANYPPFSFWRAENLADARAALAPPPLPGTPPGRDLHIPLCRQAAEFCLFRWWYAFIFEHAAVGGVGGTDLAAFPVGEGRGSDLRMRAGHARPR